MKIKYIKGDLFANLPTVGHVLLPHVCNCKGGFGSGFVVPLQKHFPIVADSYRSMFPEKLDVIGYTQFVRVNDNLTVANMVAQTLGGVRPLNYASLVEAMEQVEEEFSKGYTEIIAPMFGSALAGGNWSFIEELIHDIWLVNNIPVTIFWREDNIPNSILREQNVITN